MLVLLLSILIWSSMYDYTPISEHSGLTSIVLGSEGRRIDSLLTPYITDLRAKTNNTAGLAIGITKGTDIIYAKSFGLANLKDQIPTDLTTKFHIASVSKPFTAVAVLKLAEQGKLQLDDQIAVLLPQLVMADERYKDVTIRQILTHTSGIPRHISSDDWNNPVFGSAASEKTLADAQKAKLDFDPGAQFSYSNSGFDILGLVIEEVSSQPFEQYVQEHILRPAGMLNSLYLRLGSAMPGEWAKSYSFGIQTQEWYPYPYTENLFPSSGLKTTILDMCLWGLMHVHGGKVNGQSILQSESFAQLIHPQVETPWGDHIGLSWFLQSYLDRPIIMHQGSDTGFESIMYIYPEDSLSITVMANRDFSRTGRIINAASEILFNHPPKEYRVSARYPFVDVYNSEGIDPAMSTWNALQKDTTDIYYFDNEDLLTAGAVLENGGHWHDSKQILEQYISYDSLSTYAWRLLGNDYLNLGDVNTAKQCYEQTLIINPDYWRGKEALENLAASKK